MNDKHDGDAVNDVEGTAEAERTLVALVRATFPHDGVPDAPYERVARIILTEADATTWMRVKLAQGLDSLQTLAGGDFAALDAEGPSFDKGGYIDRGFDDLDWLPDPRVEEYDGGPLPDIIEDCPGTLGAANTSGAAVPAGQTKVQADRAGTGRTA